MGFSLDALFLQACGILPDGKLKSRMQQGIATRLGKSFASGADYYTQGTQPIMGPARGGQSDAERRAKQIRGDNGAGPQGGTRPS